MSSALRAGRMWVFVGVSLCVASCCKSEAEKAPAKPEAVASAPVTTAPPPPAVSAPPAPPPKPTDPKVLVRGKWVGESVVGTNAIPASKVSQLRLLIENESMTRANPGEPVSTLTYTVNRVEGNTLWVSLAGIPGEMSLEPTADDKLRMGQKGAPIFFVYKRGSFDIKPIKAAAASKKAWTPPASDAVSGQSRFCQDCDMGRYWGPECEPCWENPTHGSGSGTAPGGAGKADEDEHEEPPFGGGGDDDDDKEVDPADIPADEF